jgi:hypothetical protein
MYYLYFYYLLSQFHKKNLMKTLFIAVAIIIVAYLALTVAIRLTGNDQKSGTAVVSSALTSKIEFKVKGKLNDTDVFKDRIIPWISIADPGKETDSLIDANEVVTQFTKATLIIDYPLTNKATLELTTDGKGLTRKQLILLISKKYHEVYDEEEATATIKTAPPKDRGQLLNRNKTNGKYGIYGHDITDLDLDWVEVTQGADGKIYLTLEIES